MSLKRLLAQISLVLVFGVGFLFLSRMTFFMSQQEGSAMIVAFRSAANANLVCRTTTPEELAKMLPHMRQERICERTRPKTRMRITMDGHELLDRVYKPLGLNSDGVTVAFETLPVAIGQHEILVQIKDTEAGTAWNYEFSKRFEFVRDRRYLVEFKKDKGFVLHGAGL